MKIFLDCTFLRNEATGVDVTFLNLLKEICRLDTQDQFTIYIDSRYNVATLNEILQFNKNFSIKRIYSILPLQLIYSAFVFPFVLRFGKFDVYHNPYFFGPLFKGVCKKTKVIITVHDMYHRSIPDLMNSKLIKLFKFFGDNAIKKADAVIAISTQTKNDILKYLKISEGKINLIYQSFNSSLNLIPSDNSIIEKHGLENKIFFLNVGKLLASKGFKELLIQFNNLVRIPQFKDIHLVNAGQIKDEAYLLEINAIINQNQLGEHVHLTGYIGDNELKALYEHCHTIVVPSFNEGFGLPLLEAMNFKKGLIFRNIPSLQEVGSDAGLSFSTDDELLSQLETILEDENTLLQIKEKGRKRIHLFSWENSANKTMAIYKK